MSVRATTHIVYFRSFNITYLVPTVFCKYKLFYFPLYIVYIPELRYNIGNLLGNVYMYNGMKDFLYMYNVYVSY